ncbi:hypothetical protein HETIRDRAFT_117862 [Heterobasidion irregulare TC 32-1]|uniref:Uncharacterized protein n=1 Tax=Heterobasidion irregulare (strain TC 32-1) TaxID=747525 RepID=W4K1Z6_HETIT|nr:uncharacterized protein HETIRDRAFT_117862 [Heterobasidion irregulare TC 32-1]ETW79360.1 hypothetical protein HETIRDRAFT_117862 [Heterobasidion irregulare TC 32-1]
MDPPWSPSSGKRPRKRKARSPSPEQPPHSPKRASGSQLSATVLPPIREMQAFLPSPGPPSQHPEDVYPQHPQPTGFPLFSSSDSRFVSQAGPSTPAAEYNPEIMDSEPEADAEPSGRPKQKRRRQALSCTERTHVDHVLGVLTIIVGSPVKSFSDKYVSRAEFDEVKARLDKLEAIVYGTPPAALPPSSSIELSSRSATIGVGMPSAASSSRRYTEPHHQIPPFPTGPSRREDYPSKHTSSEHSNPASVHVTAPSQTAHPAPSQPHSQTYLGQPSSQSSPTFRSYESTRSPSHHFGGSGVGGDTGPGAVSIAGPSSAVKPSPFSLSAITAPYNTPVAPPLPQPHPKNSYAQTFTPLGERLCIRVVQGPAAPTYPHLSHIVDSLSRSFTPTRAPTFRPCSCSHRRRCYRPRPARCQRPMITMGELIVRAARGRYHGGSAMRAHTRSHRNLMLIAAKGTLQTSERRLHAPGEF